MNAPRRPPTMPLSAFAAAACIGMGCSAPAPPSSPPQETPAQDSADAYPPASVPIETPPPSANEAPTTATPPDTTPAPAPESPAPATPDAPRETPAQQPASPPAIAPQPPSPPATQTGDAQPSTLTITMLSRGKGVPDATRAAYKDIRALLERQRTAYAVTDLRTQRIGLEGETRLCAEFRSDKDAQAALSEIRQRAAGVELLDVSAAPCPSPKESKP